MGTPVTLRVDKQGFYLYWVDQNVEMDLLDIATIRDVRTGQYAKKPKVCNNNHLRMAACRMHHCRNHSIHLHSLFLPSFRVIGFEITTNRNDGVSTGYTRREDSNRLLRFGFCECYIY